MNPNKPIHNKRLLLWATGGLALILLVYFIAPDVPSYVPEEAYTTASPVNDTVAHEDSNQEPGLHTPRIIHQEKTDH